MNKNKPMYNKFINYFNLSNKQAVLFIFIGAFLLYANTLGNNYALDDAIVITKNEFTKQGFSGIPNILSYDSFTGFFGKEKQLVDGGRYRPLSLITFAIEYQFFGMSPGVSHFINVFIYALVALVLYLLVIQLLTNKLGLLKAKILALITAALFLLHPIHTEVVANIKGRDELLSLFFSLLAFRALFKYALSKEPIILILSALYLFLALLSKENAIAIVFVIPLALVYFTEIKVSRALLYAVPLLLAAGLFLFIRSNVLHGFHSGISSELLNNPFIDATPQQKYATLFFTWLVYFKLLLFPHPLTFDYYPYHISLTNFSNLTVIISISLILFLLALVVLGLKQKTLLSFCIISFAATFAMVSNLFFSVGVFMNERFVFMPSLFFCLALSALMVHLWASPYKQAKIVVILVTVYFTTFFPTKTIARNRVWKNDFTLFTTDVKTSVNSAKSNCSAGGKLWEEGKITPNKQKQMELYAQSEKYLRKSIAIYPAYSDAWLLLGNVLYDAKSDVAASAQCYLEVLKRQPANTNAWQNADIVLQQSTDRQMQLNCYAQLYASDSNHYTPNYRLGVLYGRYFNNLPKAIYYLKRATFINPAKADAFKDLGTAYGIMGNEKEAYQTCKKALELDKNDAQIYINLGIAASKLGLADESQMYFKQAEKLTSKGN